jgi:hypothetical protein
MIIEKTTTVEKEKLLVNYEDQMASYELQFHTYIVDTLKTGYPHVQAPSQDKRQGSSKPAACLRGSGAFLPAQGSSEGTTCPRGSDSRLPTRGIYRAATCPYGSGSCLSA